MALNYFIACQTTTAERAFFDSLVNHKLNFPFFYVVYAFFCGHPNFSGCAAVNIQRPIVGPVVEPAAEGP